MLRKVEAKLKGNDIKVKRKPKKTKGQEIFFAFFQWVEYSFNCQIFPRKSKFRRSWNCPVLNVITRPQTRKVL